jgi:probable rRNA maturation factor
VTTDGRALRARLSPPKRAPPLVEVRADVRGGRAQVRRLQRSALHFLDMLDLTGVELSVLVTGDAAIRALNRTWRGKDRPTDVLSFPAGAIPPGAPGRRPLGDVIVSIDTARRQAREHGQPLGDELDQYLAHGLLHLLGHDHHRPGDARRMAALEDRLLGRTGMVRPSLRGN